MKSIRYLLLLSSLIPLLSCKSPGSALESRNAIWLHCWINNREEQTNSDTLIYRHCDYYPEFPISRYRNQFVLKENHEASYLILAPDDGHYMKDCTWMYDEQSKKLSFHFPGNPDATEYRVLEITGDKLVMTYY